jgi:Ca2+-transporting ATPase
MRKLKPQGKVWSERTNSQTNAQMVVALFDLFKEPMLLLLIAVAVIYFVMGQNNEAYFMLAAIVVVSEFLFIRTTAVGLRWALEKLNEPLSTVLRNGEP